MASLSAPQAVPLADWDYAIASDGQSAPAIPHSESSAAVDVPAVYLQGARLNAITEQHCVELILASLDARRGGSVNTMNLDHVRRFVQDKNFAALYDKASIVTADGMPLIWASSLRGTPLPERVTGSSLIFSLSAAAVQPGRSIFLLGGSPGTAQKAANVLARRYPSLRITGVSSKPDKFTVEESDWQLIGEMLSAAKPDIVFVALSCPRQEKLIDALRHTLPAAWWIGVGNAFSFVAGTVPRAPLWMQRTGLEWFHRLLKEPRRLARRYLIQGLPFAVTLFRTAARERFSVQRNLRKP
jgi:N-acetylglucosaminyldiphosphoundecaprenol N-acetyl-beta-D-mannosaminyltransferase